MTEIMILVVRYDPDQSVLQHKHALTCHLLIANVSMGIMTEIMILVALLEQVQHVAQTHDVSIQQQHQINVWTQTAMVNTMHVDF